MLRLTRIRKFRISNSVAALAAFLLIAAAVAGNSLSATSGVDAARSTAMMGADQAADTRVETVRSVRGNKGFKISLYLFRRN